MRTLLLALVFLNDRLKRLSIKLVKWTGKSREAIHPKHFLENEPIFHWYFEALKPGGRVLDIGCGMGTHMFKAAETARFVVGMEYDIKKLALVSRRAAERGLRSTQGVAVNAEHPFPFADGSFDNVIFIDVLEHLNNRDQALREVHRVLTPGGVMCLCVPNRETSWKKRLKKAGLFFYSDRDHKIEYTWDELEKELTRAGFSIQKKFQSVYDFPLGGLIDVVGGFSLSLYRRLIYWKHDLARRHPGEAVGFFVFCERGS